MSSLGSISLLDDHGVVHFVARMSSNRHYHDPQQQTAVEVEDRGAGHPTSRSDPPKNEARLARSPSA